MNNHKFKNIEVHLNLNATVKKETYIELFSNKENIIDYVSKMYDFMAVIRFIVSKIYIN